MSRSPSNPPGVAALGARRIAILGSAGSGKTWLVQALTKALNPALNSGVNPHQPWQICDDTALQRMLASTVATSSAGNPAQPSTLESQQALAQHRLFDHTLLLGMDLAPPSDADRSLDALLRRALSEAGLPFQVIYGTGEARLTNALGALRALPAKRSTGPFTALLPRDASDSAEAPRQAWRWTCDKCSDPACEHRLLSDLLAARAGERPAY